MSEQRQPTYVAFHGERRISSGSLETVARAVKAAEGGHRSHALLVFDAATSRVMDLDLRGSLDEVAARYAAPPEEEGRRASAAPSRRGPGRPRLGVVSREVTLLPRHWAWLAAQRGGASVTLRRLVDQARKAGEGDDAVRRSQDAAYRFMAAMAGDRPGYEEAIRALFAGDRQAFEDHVRPWPADVATHSLTLAEGVWAKESTPDPGGAGTR